MQSSPHPFVAALYATARRHLARAKREQLLALDYAAQQYEGGRVGKMARRLYAYHHAKRALELSCALRERRKASVLRAELGRLATSDTVPPSTRSVA